MVFSTIFLFADYEQIIRITSYNVCYTKLLRQSNILGGTTGAIGVNVVFFDSSFYSTSLDTFTVLDSVAAINSFADLLDSFLRPGSGGTVISAGVNRAVSLLTSGSSGLETTNLVIDVSGDGTSTSSTTQAARDAAAAAGITVNGLAIEGSTTSTTITDS